jgi:hypothetical protein
MAHENEFKVAVVKAEPMVRKKFDAMLPLSGWPPTVRASVSLDVTPEWINVVWPTNLEKQVKDLEYGSIGKPPTHFIKKVEEMIENEITSALTDITFDMLLERGTPV